jgi:UDP-N-acetylmuramoylalanine--D-glutamate ligase
MGRSGQAAARYALATGAAVTCTDLRTDALEIAGCRHVYGRHDRADFLGADQIVVSPGVSARQPDLVAARAEGIPVVSELGSAAAVLQDQGVDIVAVTGTNGKSSVTHYCGILLRQAGRRVFVGGNLGRPLTEALEAPEPIDVAVVEVSSYQLELPGTLRPKVAAILNLAPDHLERHGNMETYAATKQRLFDHMTADGWAAVPGTDPTGLLRHGGTDAQHAWLDDGPGVRLDGDTAVLEGTPDDGAVSLAQLNLLGAHNRQNAAAAIWMAVTGGAPRDAVDPGRLTALPHRLEPVHAAGGISWVNDSKATNVDAALVGIAGVDRPLVVLLGGKGKPGADYKRLRPVLEARARAIVCFGEAGPLIARVLFGLPVIETASMKNAVRVAATLAETDDVVLLSPACASFDEFTDFEARGHAFGLLAREIHP